MDPQARVHGWKEERYRYQVCRRTFAATMGTPFFRLQSPVGLVLVVLNLLSWGCPVQACVHTSCWMTGRSPVGRSGPGSTARPFMSS